VSTRIEWAGVVCLARGFRLSRGTGTRPATGRVRLALEDLGGRALPEVGGLVVEEPGVARLEVPGLWAAEVRREDDGAVLVVELVDARWWWADRGRPVTLRGRAPLEAQVGACLAALPGGWRARDMDLAQGRAQVLAEVVGAPALDVLERLLAVRQVVLAPRLDGEARVWQPGRGEVDEGRWTGFVSEDLRGTRLATNAASAVEVTLPPPVYEASVDWCVPVVSIRWSGQTWVEDYDAELPARLRARLVKEQGGEQAIRLVESAGSVADAAEEWTFSGAWAKKKDAGLPADALAYYDWQLQARAFAEDQAASDAAAILGMPTAGPDVDPASYGLGLPAGIVEQLQAQAGRLYRLPREHAHLAPILPLPVVDQQGGRLPAEVEAFGWVEVKSTYQVEDNEAQEALDDKREAAQIELQAVEERLRYVEDRLRARGGAEVERAWNAARALLAPRSVPLPLLPQSAPSAPLAVARGLIGAAADGFGEWRRTGSLVDSAAAALTGATVEQVVAARDLFAAASRRAVFEAGGGKAAVFEIQVEQELTRQRDQLVARRRALAAVADPQRAARLRLEAATQAAAAAYRASGVVSEEAEAELAAARAGVANAAHARPARAMRPLVESRYLNAPRAVVDATIRADGLIETAKPVGWLGDPGARSPSESPWIYMPVRVTFGTQALRRPAPLPDALRDLDDRGLPIAPIVRAGAIAVRDALATPLAGAWLGEVGSSVPAAEGGPLTIREALPTAGPDAPAVQERVDGPEWTVLVPRDQRRRTDEPIELRARALAREVLRRPRTRAAGDVVLIGPWPVEVDGVVSQVSWASNEDGTVDTTVSFAPAQRPLAAWEAPEVRMGYVEGGA
jgi:hypothetical protein